MMILATLTELVASPWFGVPMCTIAALIILAGIWLGKRRSIDLDEQLCAAAGKHDRLWFDLVDKLLQAELKDTHGACMAGVRPEDKPAACQRIALLTAMLCPGVDLAHAMSYLADDQSTPADLANLWLAYQRLEGVIRGLVQSQMSSHGRCPLLRGDLRAAMADR